MKSFSSILIIIFIQMAFLSATTFGDDNASPHADGWFYIPGLDRSLEECLVIELDYGEVWIELFAEDSPNHVARIKELANNGSFDGVAFHRVIEGFMVQTGDVQFGKRESFNSSLVGTGGSGYPDLRSEFNERIHLRGTCSMARSMAPDSANSQFFICLENSTFLDRQYTVWGQVVRGMEYVDSIKKGNESENGKVEDPDFMKTVRIRQLEHEEISGWLYTTSSCFPYFFDLATKNWMYFQSGNEKPRFYHYGFKKWMSVR